MTLNAIPMLGPIGSGFTDSRPVSLSYSCLEHCVELNDITAQSLEHGTLQNVLRYAITVPRAAFAPVASPRFSYGL
jgi:hypothetical protein